MRADSRGYSPPARPPIAGGLIFERFLRGSDGFLVRLTNRFGTVQMSESIDCAGNLARLSGATRRELSRIYASAIQWQRGNNMLS